MRTGLAWQSAGRAAVGRPHTAVGRRRNGPAWWRTDCTEAGQVLCDGERTRRGGWPARVAGGAARLGGGKALRGGGPTARRQAGSCVVRS